MMARQPELIASYFTLAGDAVPFVEAEKEVSPHTLEARAQAAAKAGFSGLGLSYPDLNYLTQSMSFADIRAELDSHGLKYLELECIVDWYADGARLERSNTVRKLLLDCAAAIGACHIKVAAEQNDGTWPWEMMVDRFGALCADAKAAGTHIVVEPMPWSNISTISESVRLVEETSADNGGVLYDIWHVARAGEDFSRLGEIPPEAIGYVELCDALLGYDGNMKSDTIDNRRLCGEGELNVAEFVKQIRDTGYDGLWGVEVISHQQRARSPISAATLTAVSAMDFLQAP